MGEQSIGSYKVIGELGRGAMGVVYHGFDPAIGRPVAIKVIRFSQDVTADERAQLRQRLVREASAAGKLSHPNLVTVYQLGEEGQDVFIAMEFVQGVSLRQLLGKQGPLPQDRSLNILRQAAEGLDYAHRAGIIHRDVKPDNVLIREDGCVKIADFGIAKVIESTTHHLTVAGSSVGSPSYMSPEQIKAEQLDSRSDQFSLAVVAFEMLAGRKPFNADSMAALMHQIIMVDPMSSPETQNRLPHYMLPAFSRALAKNPAERFATCGEFIAALAQGAASESTTKTIFRRPDVAAASTAESTQPTAQLRPPSAVPSSSAPATASASPKKSSAPVIAGVAALILILAGIAYWIKQKPSVAGASTTTGSSAKRDSALVTAVTENRLADAKKLLDGGADVNDANPDGTTALMIAAEGSGYLQNNAPALQMVLEKNPKIEAEDKRGQTALYRAVAAGKDESLKILLEHKADPNHRASDGSSPLLAAVTYGKMAALNMLLAAGANIETADNRGWTPLMQAAEGTGYIPNNAPYVKLLLEKGAKVDVADGQGRSTLYLASADGKTDAVNLLLDSKADPNQKTNNGETPLISAVSNGKTDVVKVLLARGATVDAADASGNTPLMRAAEANAYIPNNGPLVEMLLQAGAKPDLQDQRGRTAFYRAAEDGKEDAMRILLDHKANSNIKPADGSTPLMAAVGNAKVGAVKFLLDHGADVNAANSSGRTPLMAAADTVNPQAAELVTLLLAKGAKKDAKDDRGRTALSLATDSKNTAVLDLLK